MFAYCNNNPVNYVDPTGLSFIDVLSAACDNLLQYLKAFLRYIAPLDEDEKVLIATIAAEGTWTTNREFVSSSARQAMANVALNRVGSREWAEYDSVAEICQETGFDGCDVNNNDYTECLDYLNNRDGTNKIYERIIWDVMKAYTWDITNGCQLFYTPATMTIPGSIPNWNFDYLTEVEIEGVDSYYEGRFFKYK